MENHPKSLDYSNFGSVAKTRFQRLAASHGFECVSPTKFVRPNKDWYECFELWSVSFAREFRILFGIKPSRLDDGFFPGLCEYVRNPDGSIRQFSKSNKVDIEKSSKEFFGLFSKIISPWFSRFSSLEDVGNALSVDLDFYAQEIKNYNCSLPRLKNVISTLEWVGRTKEASYLRQASVHDLSDIPRFNK